MFSCRVITTHAELAALAMDWRRFPALRTPYSGPAYALTWLASHPEARPCVITVRDPGGSLVALAPWCLVGQASGIRVLTGIGAEEAPCHDPVFQDPSRIEPLATVLVEGLATGPAWDLALLTLQADLLGPLRRTLGKLGWAAEQTEEWRQSYLVEFHGGWEAFWGRCSGSVSRKHRNIGHRLKEHRIRLLEADERTWEALLKRLFFLHGEKLGHIRDWNPVYREMRAIAAEAMFRKELGLLALEVDGQPAALELSVRRGDRAFALVCAYDPQFASFSVGTLLHTRTLEHWCRKGLCAVDLGPGRFVWKDRFRATAVPMTQLVVGSRHSLAGSSLVAWKSVIRPIVKPMYRSVVRNFRAASF